MPKLVLGFATYAADHPEVGEPVENECLERTGVNCQDTTTGTLRYYATSNLIVFSPLPKA